MFRALLAHPQEVLHKRHLVYCVRMFRCLSWVVKPYSRKTDIHVSVEYAAFTVTFEIKMLRALCENAIKPDISLLFN
jgi:hypothetical protein